MNSSRILRIEVFPLNAPLVRPFRTALGQHDRLENLLVQITLTDRTVGFGEAALAPHITGETVSQTKRNIARVGQNLIGRDVRQYKRISALLHELLPTNKAAVAGIETALFDALAKQKHIPLWKMFGDRCRSLKTDITIVIASLKETKSTAAAYYKQGFRAFKIKIGRDEELDFKRVMAVHRAVKKSRIYLDANQGYSACMTLRFVEKLKNAGVRPAMIEQPVPKEDWEGLQRVTRLSKIPICADESVRSLADCKAAIRDKAVNVINIKLMKSGLVEAPQIAQAARKAGIELMIGGMMESSLAMTAAAHVAAGLGCFKYVDLDTPFFIRDGLRQNPYLSSDGVYDLKNVKAGVGIEVMRI